MRCQPPAGGTTRCIISDLSITLVGAQQLAGRYAQALRLAAAGGPYNRSCVLDHL
jgi:hypothetical protein